MALPPFQVFMDVHRTDVHRFLVAAVGHSDADDCFQETFMSALRAYPKLEPGSNLRGWVLTIAHRKALDTHRARNGRSVPVAEVPEGSFDPSANGRPELWNAARRLPAKQRTALLYRFAGDLSYTQVAEAMGTSADAARRNVHEALKKLREVVST